MLSDKRILENRATLAELGKELSENVLARGVHARSTLEHCHSILPVETLMDTDTVAKISDKKHWLKQLTNPKSICKMCCVLILVLCVAVGFYLIPSQFWVFLFSWIQSLGYWAPVIFFAFEVIACTLSIPPTFTLVFAGFLLGWLWGIVAGHLAHILGSTILFWIDRIFLRKPMKRKFGDNKFYRALEIATERNSFKIAVMLRACPLLPIVAVTHMLSLAGVKYWHFLLATATILIFEESFYVYLGSTASSLTKVASGDVSAGGWVQTSIMVVGVILSIVMAVGASLMVKFQIDKVLKEEKRKKIAVLGTCQAMPVAESGSDSASDASECSDSVGGDLSHPKMAPDEVQEDQSAGPSPSFEPATVVHAPEIAPPDGSADSEPEPQ